MPLPSHVTIVQASETVGMDGAATSVRRKRDASINVCMRLVREDKADAVVTAGHTGCGVASAILHLGRLPGVDRPALAIQMVTDRGPFVLLDIGATTDANGRNLAQYARMAALYAERVLGVEDPSVALLSIGEERGKGDLRVQEATTLLEAMDLRFIGNVGGTGPAAAPGGCRRVRRVGRQRGHEVLRGLSSVMFEMLRREFRRTPWGPIGYFFMLRGLNRIRRRFDYERLGGSPLLGVKGTVLITHGRAKRRMIGFAVEVGAAAARARIPESIAAALAADGLGRASEVVATAAPLATDDASVAPGGDA